MHYRSATALISVFFFLVCIAAGCASTGSAVDPRMTQLGIRSFQTRTYDTTDTLMVMKALLNVLQDEFYIVKNADTTLGLITATKEVDLEDRGFFSRLFRDEDDRWKKHCLVECSGNVSSFGSQTRVRMNFQMKTFDNHGSIMEIHQIQEPDYYQRFFSKVDKGIFIEKENL